MKLLNRIDNLFVNTRKVAKLAQFYSRTFGLPIRREQILKPGLMWAEILVGGMELSFRLSAGTPKQHPNLKGQFLETRPGDGVTISFEVTKTERVRAALARRGVKFVGPVISCTGGKELISIFQDFEGRAVQLYEAKFASQGEAFRIANRPAGLERSPIGANIRDVRSMALSVTFLTNDLEKAEEFYGGCLGLSQRSKSSDSVVFELDGSLMEFRRKLGALETNGKVKGGIAAIEIRDISYAEKLLEQKRSKTQRVPPPTRISTKDGDRLIVKDLEGNFVQLWERS